MCGICAIISLKNQPVNPSYLLEMGNIITHRGPDDEGYVIFKKNEPKWFSLPSKRNPFFSDCIRGCCTNTKKA